MGKYSIDAFEQYSLQKIRPRMTAMPLSHYRLLTLSWAELEGEKGHMMPPDEIGAGNVILRLALDRAGDTADACGFIRRMGRCYQGGSAFGGVVMSAGSGSGAELLQLAQAYAQGFENTFLLAEPGTALMEACCAQHIRTGLWLDLNRGILNLRRAVAEGGHQKNWRDMPVYVSAGRPLAEEELDAAIRWHAVGADRPAPLGSRMTLRRMMFPQGLTTGGLMPLRLWWQNMGTAPFYEQIQLYLELRRGGERFAIDAPGFLDHPGMGDSTMNLTAKLPRVSCGSYELWCGLKSADKFLTLAMEADEDSGMYRVGEVTLDDAPRPYLATMWEEQYADGYYPLEDPAQPE